MGKTQEDVRNVVESYSRYTATQARDVQFPKGFVVYIHQCEQENKSFTKSAKRIKALAEAIGIQNVNESALSTAIQKCFKKYLGKRANPERDWETFTKFLEEPFVIPLVTVATQLSPPSNSENQPEAVPLAPINEKLPALQTRQDANCSSCDTKRRSLELSVEKNNELRCALRAVKRSKSSGSIDVEEKDSFRKTKQALQRKKNIETNLRDERRDLKASVTNLRKDLEKKEPLCQSPENVTNLKRSRTMLKLDNEKKDSKIKKLKYSIQALAKENTALKCEVDQMRCEVEEMKVEKTVISTKRDGKTYSSKFRKAAYGCLVSGVPVECIGIVIRSVIKNVTGTDLESVPDASTCSQFAYELGVIADVQAGEEMVKTDNLTLSWDATSLDGEHINEVHINLPTTPPRGLVLQIDILAGGAAVDYTYHVKESIKCVITSYAKCFEQNKDELLRTVINHLKNTLTDRVAVNHCVVRELEKDFEISMLELNCNLHPLDGVAGRCRTVLHKCDQKYEIKGQILATCGAKVVNLIYGVSKLRYKQGKGDPTQFKLFVKKNQVRPGLLVRYVGNRFHVMFHLAGVIYSLRPKLTEFVTETSSGAAKELKRAIKADLQNRQLIIHLRVLGLLGKFLTAPWMRLFYKNSENYTNLETTEPLRKAVQSLQAVEANPLSLLSRSTDAFGQPIDAEDGILASLFQDPVSGEDSEELQYTLTAICSGAVAVLQKQLKSYLEGNLSNPSPEMLQQTASAPLHNIFAEQTLGITDNLFRRAPNASIGFIDGKVRAKKNHTLSWLEGKSTVDQEHIINFAIRRGAEVRAIRRRQAELIEKRKKQKQIESKQKKEKSDKKKLEEQLLPVISGTVLIQDVIPDLTSEAIDTANKIISDCTSIVGMCVNHIWEGNDGENVLYSGRVLRYKDYKGIGPAYVIAYWGQDETEDDSVDYKLKVKEILLDVASGDLEFMA